jgi:hypothetical protein
MKVNEVLETMSNESVAVVMSIGDYFVVAYKKDLINDKCFIDKKVGDRTVTHLGITRNSRGFAIVIQCIINNEENKDSLEKALDKACKYIHNDGIDGCPCNYDLSTISDKKMNECNICDYQCMSLNDQLNSSKSQENEYLKKSMKCWKEYFLRGDTENDKK